MNKRLYGITLLSLSLLTLGAGAQQRHELSARQAAAYAMKNSVLVKNALVDVQVQEQTNREITASAFPQINANTSAAYNPNVTTQTFPNFIGMATYGVLEKEGVSGTNGPIKMPADLGYIQAQFGTKFNNSLGIDLQQLLFEGQVFVGLQARATSMQFARKNVEVTEENIKANVYKIYYQLAAAKNQLNIIDANLTRVQKLADDTRKLYENGFAERLSVDVVNVQLTNMQTQRQKVINGIENGYLGLKYLMGMPVKDTLILTDSVTYEDIRSGVLDASVYDYSDRKEYQYAELGKQLNEFNVKRYKLTYFPTVALASNYMRLRQSNKFGFGGPWYPSSQIGLRVSVPIFDGFARAARIQRAKLQLQQTENRMEDLKQSIDREVQQAINDYNSSLVSLDAQRRNMELAEKVYNQTKKKFEAGTGSTTEITDADVNLRTAQTNYTDALYSAIIAKIDFLKATGKLQ